MPLSPSCFASDSIPLIEEKTTAIIDELIDSLPDLKQLTSEERRGIIARYTSVLEGNFIYWMTAAVIAAKAEQSRPILLENLYEEVQDCHPLMMRKFALAANAFPTDQDSLAVNDDLTKVRQFLGNLSPVKSVLMMGFFEGFIQKFMSYLASLAAEQGSTEMEYTDVHGVCDIEHTAGLFKVLAAEIAWTPPDPDADIFEGVTLLRDSHRAHYLATSGTGFRLNRRAEKIAVASEPRAPQPETLRMSVRSEILEPV